MSPAHRMYVCALVLKGRRSPATLFNDIYVSTMILAVLMPTGCSRSPYELAPVSGTVRIDGQPLSTGKVMFAPVGDADSVDAGKPAIGCLRPDGTFELSTYKEGDGAVVGSHWITIYGPGKEDPPLPAGVPPFERMTVRDGTKEVVGGEDNYFEIEVPVAQIRKFARPSD
jgi:hypothetical protein